MSPSTPRSSNGASKPDTAAARQPLGAFERYPLPRARGAVLSRSALSRCWRGVVADAAVRAAVYAATVAGRLTSGAADVASRVSAVAGTEVNLALIGGAQRGGVQRGVARLQAAAWRRRRQMRSIKRRRSTGSHGAASCTCQTLSHSRLSLGVGVERGCRLSDGDVRALLTAARRSPGRWRPRRASERDH